MIADMFRTESIAKAEKMRDLPLQLILGPDSTGKVATMAHLAISLALRTFSGPITVYGAKRPGIGKFGGSDLESELIELEKDWGKGNRIEFRTENIDESVHTVRIGQGPGPGCCVDAAGWVSGINCIFPAEIDAELPSMAFSVAAVFGMLFRKALGESVQEQSWTFDLLNFKKNVEAPTRYRREKIFLGKVGLLGAGAIGSAFSQVVALSGWSADIEVIDSQAYEEPNHETTFMIGFRDVLSGPKKAEWLADRLRAFPSISAQPLVTRINDRSSELTLRRRIFICGVDNSETRRVLDNVNSELLLNAGVGGTYMDAGHVLVTRHQAGDRPLSTLYPKFHREDVGGSNLSSYPAEFQEQCSRIYYDSVSLAAPFMGLAAGALLAAQCAQYVLSVDPGINYLKLDLFGIQAAFDARFQRAVQIHRGLPVRFEEEVPPEFEDQRS